MHNMDNRQSFGNGGSRTWVAGKPGGRMDHLYIKDQTQACLIHIIWPLDLNPIHTPLTALTVVRTRRDLGTRAITYM